MTRTTSKKKAGTRHPTASRIRNDHVAGLALFFLALGIMWAAHRLPLGSLRSPGPGYMPMLLAIVLAGLGLLVMWRAGSSPRLSTLRWPEAAHALKIALACGFAALALERLGYRLTVIILLVFLLGVIERRRFIPVAAVALGLSFGTFFLVSDLLRVPLPRSPWGF